MRLIVLTQHQLQYAVLCATCQYQKDQTSRSQQNWHDGRTPGQQKCTWCISSSSIVTICYDSLWFKAVAWVNSKWGPCLARRTGPNTASSNQLKSCQNMSEQHPTPIISYSAAVLGSHLQSRYANYMPMLQEMVLFLCQVSTGTKHCIPATGTSSWVAWRIETTMFGRAWFLCLTCCFPRHPVASTKP